MDNLVLYDDVCNLCCRIARFLKRHDKHKVIGFASLNSETGINLMMKSGFRGSDTPTLIYSSSEGMFFKSAAVFRILKDLGYPWNLLYGFMIIPRSIRDSVYMAIAGNRYRLFGKTERCTFPSA